jgi:hypothetical protein
LISGSAGAGIGRFWRCGEGYILYGFYEGSYLRRGSEIVRAKIIGNEFVGDLGSRQGEAKRKRLRIDLEDS